MAMRMMDISGRNPGLALQKGTRRINQRVVFHGGTAKQHAVAHFVAVGQRDMMLPPAGTYDQWSANIVSFLGSAGFMSHMPCADLLGCANVQAATIFVTRGHG